MRSTTPTATCVLLILALNSVSTAQRNCPGTSFQCLVDDAVERGIVKLRQYEDGRGFIYREGYRNGNFLAVLALMEQYAVRPWDRRPRGYAGLSRDDQDTVQRLLRYAITHEPALQGRSTSGYNYTVGGTMMALTGYLATGGPDELGAPVTAHQALTNAVNSTLASQGSRPADQAGGWNYIGPLGTGDQSVTQFVVPGLVAAEEFVPDATNSLGRTVTFLRASTNADGGVYYRHGNSRMTMTAAGVWMYRLGGLDTSAPEIQRALSWMHSRWTPEDNFGFGGQAYYGFWTVDKALSFAEQDGLGGQVFAEHFAHYDPSSLGFIDEPASAYFDLAYTLLQWQDPDGDWSGQVIGSSPGFAALIPLTSCSRC